MKIMTDDDSADVQERCLPMISIMLLVVMMTGNTCDQGGLG